MGRQAKNPCKHIVSFRVNEQELETLEQKAVASGMSRSRVMREILLKSENISNNKQF